MTTDTLSSDASGSFAPSRGRQLAVLAGLLALSAAVAGIGGWWTSTSVQTWYPTLDKPAWTPPSAVFGPVWTVLYALMAVAAWLVWRRGGWSANRLALTLYFVQLGLNCVWSGIFFGLQEIGWGFVDIAALWLVLLATTVLFFRRRSAAGWLLVPYLLWVTYAGALNFALWRMN